MSRIAILGAGAFGTALAIALARSGRPVTLLARDADDAGRMEQTRVNPRHLPGATLPPGVRVQADPALLGRAEAVLVAVPMQKLAAALAGAAGHLGGGALVACCKGVDLATLRGPTAILAETGAAGPHAVLTGPSFAGDIARGLPTALTLAARDPRAGRTLQALLSTPLLRLYRTTDVTGAELGGAIKNVIAIAAGVAIGAGLGESARAALMTRGYAEMVRFARAFGARPRTIGGLSGLGDLVLTCTSEQSRNFRHGLALGHGTPPEAEVTVEGVATAGAIVALAARHRIEMPIAATVAALCRGDLTTGDAVDSLLARPLRAE